MRIDLHTHSSVSDGTDEPAELVRRAQQAGLDVVALTDHDTFDGLDEAVAEGERIGLPVVRGMEMSCARQGRSVHLLAYGADPAEPALAAELHRVRGGRTGRLAGVLAKLAELGVPVTEAAVMEEVGLSPSVGRPHIADALVKAGHVRDRTGGVRPVPGRWRPRPRAPVRDRCRTRHRPGPRAPVGSRSSPIPGAGGGSGCCPSRCSTRLVEEHGLDGIEVDHQDHDADVRARLRRMVDELGPAGHRLERLPRHRQDRPRPGLQHHRPRRLRRDRPPDRRPVR